MKPIIKIEKRGKDYCVILIIGNQGFPLAYRGTKDDCKWMAQTLAYALELLSKPPKKNK